MLDNRPCRAAGTELSREIRRRDGIYYSPDDVAATLVEWAVRRPVDTVFDPSFGGCVFLSTAYDRLRRLGASDPAKQLHGTDKDPEAWSGASWLVQLGVGSKQLQLRDFLVTQPSDIGGPFTVVLGNPPYVRVRHLATLARSAAESSLPESISAKGSYWAYFVLHAMTFIALGGRMALILPGTFLRADYAAPVRAQIRRAFGSVRVVALDEHLFSGAEEVSVLLLADRRGEGPGTVEVATASRHDRLAETRPGRTLAKDADRNWAQGLFDNRAQSTYRNLRERIGTLSLTAHAGIGVVTGDNRFFLVDANTASTAGIEPSELTPIVSRTNELPGVELTLQDVRSLKRRLFLPTVGALQPGAAAYVRAGEALGVNERRKCRDRHPWYVPRDTTPPDAFLSSMVWTNARLTMNPARALCTNTLLSVRFNVRTEENDRAALTLGALSTVAQFSAEFEGRVSGGGLLKLEPRDASRLVVPHIAVTAPFWNKVNNLCRNGAWEEARDLVDSQLIGRYLDQHELTVLRRALLTSRERRRVGKVPHGR